VSPRDSVKMGSLTVLGIVVFLSAMIRRVAIVVVVGSTDPTLRSDKFIMRILLCITIDLVVDVASGVCSA